MPVTWLRHWLFELHSIKSTQLATALRSWHLICWMLRQRSPTFLAPGTSFVEDNFPRTGGQGDGSGGNASDGEWWGAADEASLARPPLTSCCAGRFLTGRGPVLIHGPGGCYMTREQHMWAVMLWLPWKPFTRDKPYCFTQGFYSRIIKTSI